MTFTSFNFIVFFPAVLLLFYLIPNRFRNLFLLVVSFWFYINIKPVFILIVSFIILLTYFATLLIESNVSDFLKLIIKRTSIILVLLPLLFFKYYSDINIHFINFLSQYSIRWPLPDIKYILPIGISYYTFMSIGYIIDVYNEEIKADRNLIRVSLFISFFPLILSGPIERAKNMLPQFKNVINFNSINLSSSFNLILWGYFMKLVVADRLDIYIDSVFTNTIDHNGTTLLFASILYPFQVYTDLGGYSLIAIGTAKGFGINVMQNFKRPFFAITISEFWRRWHISLISWLLDYVYTPLSFNFRNYKIYGIILSLMITFIISGIWHGAALTFVVWGVIQGIFVSFDALIKKRRSKVEKKFNLKNNYFYITFGIVTTFILFSSTQIFVITNNLYESYLVFYKIIFSSGQLFIGSYSYLIYSIFGIFIVIIKDFIDEFYTNKLELFNNKNILIRGTSLAITIIIILLIGVFDGGQFIYFKY